MAASVLPASPEPAAGSVRTPAALRVSVPLRPGVLHAPYVDRTPSWSRAGYASTPPTRLPIRRSERGPRSATPLAPPAPRIAPRIPSCCCWPADCLTPAPCSYECRGFHSMHTWPGPSLATSKTSPRVTLILPWMDRGGVQQSRKICPSQPNSFLVEKSPSQGGCDGSPEVACPSGGRVGGEREHGHRDLKHWERRGTSHHGTQARCRRGPVQSLAVNVPVRQMRPAGRISANQLAAMTCGKRRQTTKGFRFSFGQSPRI